MIPSDTYYADVFRQTVLGGPSAGKALADFAVNCYINGATYSPTPVVTEVGATADGLATKYTLAIALSSTAGVNRFRIAPATGTDLIWPDVHTVDTETNDLDTIAGFLQTSQGIPGVQSAADGTLGDVVMGDAWQSGTLTVPLGKISPFGYSDLTGMTITAAFKNAPADTAVTCSASILDASARTVKAYFDTFPVGLNLTSTEYSKPFFLDLQLKHTASGKIITPLRYQLNVAWQRDVTA